MVSDVPARVGSSGSGFGGVCVGHLTSVLSSPYLLMASSSDSPTDPNSSGVNTVVGTYMYVYMYTVHHKGVCMYVHIMHVCMYVCM